ncbi:hypothetical protein H0H92_015258 [Tricholoma furcatifolium]|nr:hypothetical protein H0H92_015258 [Tricholoma furcatifolium]
MRVAASIGEPFTLSTYATSQQPIKSGSTSKKKRGNPSVFATYGKASGSSDGCATVTAQAEGVHVLDISTLHPVISHTLGPSTTFACPAITCRSQGTEATCSTYAVISTSSDVTAEESGRTIWMWKDTLSGQLEEHSSQKKKTVVLHHQISGLYVCDEIPTRILAQSSEAELTLLDTDLNIKNTWPSSKDADSSLKTFFYARTSCSFLPAQTAPHTGAIIVSADAAKDSIRVRILSIDDSDGISELSHSSLPLKSDHIVDLSCSPTGFLSFLTRDGTWSCYRIEPTDSGSCELSAISEPIRLTGLSFASKTSSTTEVSLLSLTSSHVLLAALTASPTPEIILLLWDLQYSVLLTSYSVPIPSTLTHTKDIKVTLVPASTSQALLVLSPLTSDVKRKSQETPSRSTILIVPFTCPATSTIANAMGRASSSAKWIEQAGSSSVNVPPHDPTRMKVLAAMKTAMDKNLPQAANKAFFDWETRETKSAAEASKEAGALPKAILGHSFVKDLLTMVLQPSKPANAPYSSEVVRHLLSRKLVSSSMMEGGLLATLRYRNDWQSVQLAFKYVIDLSEAEIIDSLHFVVAHHRSNAVDDNAMDVDSATDMPSLPTFLSLCVSYKTTQPALRTAIRRSLKEADDILAVLRILEGWTKQHSLRNVRLLPSNKDLVKNAHGVFVVKEKEKEVGGDLPPLLDVLSFLQTLLDASFLTILQHPPAHAVLKHIQAHIEPEIGLIDDLEQLRGPLETFAKAHTKAIKEAGQDKRKKPVGDWRQRRKQAHEQAGLSIGLYRLEELVL